MAINNETLRLKIIVHKSRTDLIQVINTSIRKVHIPIISSSKTQNPTNVTDWLYSKTSNGIADGENKTTTIF